MGFVLKVVYMRFMLKVVYMGFVLKEVYMGIYTTFRLLGRLVHIKTYHNYPNGKPYY
jgi:hypothetical protein